MSRKNKLSKESFFKKHRRFTLTLILFLVVFPLVLITSMHFYQAVIVKPVLFGNSDFKLTKEQNYFSIEAELVEIESATSNTKQRFVFDYEIKDISITNPKVVTKIEGQLSPKYHAYNSLAASVGSRMKSDQYQKLEIEYDFKESFFPLIKANLPILFIKIDYWFNHDLTGIEEADSIIVKINYNVSDSVVY